MDIITIGLFFLIGYISLYLGLTLGILSPEEMLPGKKHIHRFQTIAFICMILLLSYNLVMHQNFISLAALGIVYFTISHKKIPLTELQKYAFMIPFLLVSLIKQPILLEIQTGLLVLFMIPTGTMQVMNDVKKEKLTKKKKQLFIELFQKSTWYLYIAAFLLILIATLQTTGVL